jgi:hypothetical protein
MFEYYEQYGFTGNSKILSFLLNRPATKLQTFIQKQIC